MRCRILDHRSFRFGEAPYRPDAPGDGPWRSRSSHFRLILDPDIDARVLEEPAHLPRPWAELVWVPALFSRTAITRRPGRHFWIVPRAGRMARLRRLERVTRLNDTACVRAAMCLYDEYLLGEEALAINFEAHGRHLIGLAHRFAFRMSAFAPRMQRRH